MTNLSGNNWDITFADAAKTLGDLYIRESLPQFSNFQCGGLWQQPGVSVHRSLNQASGKPCSSTHLIRLIVCSILVLLVA